MHTDGSRRPRPGPDRRGRYRDEILDMVAGGHGPISAQDIHHALRQRGAPAGLSTVYRELHALAQSGHIHEFRIGDELLYRLARTEPERYVICDRCGRVEPAPPGWSRVLNDAALAGFLDLAGPLSIHGRCKECPARPL